MNPGRREGCTADECELLIKNAETLMEGARMQLAQARRALHDPSLLQDRVERAKSLAMNYVLRGLEQIQNLQGPEHSDDQ